MTRQEFLDNINDWDDLLGFCRDEECDICEDIYDESDMDDYINEHLVDMASDASNWYSFRDNLSEIPSGAGWYLYNSYFDWDELTDDDFEDYKSDVCDWMDDGGYWDEEDDEYEVEDYLIDDEEPAPYTPPAPQPDPDDLVPIDDEDISMTELFSACSKGLQSITKATLEEKQAAEQEAEESFNDFVAEFKSMSITMKKRRRG